MKPTIRSIVFLAVVPVLFQLRASAQVNEAMEGRIQNLLRQMTLEEKISLLSGTGFESRGIPRLGIPPLNMTDGPVGVRRDTTTAFPASIALAASWDPPLARRYGRAIGQEAKAKGRSMLLGPCININRVPLGGRSFESYGEDPFLTSRIAVEYIQGVQSEKVAACVKHYAANNQEWERDSISVEAQERTMREIYFPAFRAAVQEGGSWGVMSAYNKVNGVWCSENPFLLTDVLKNEWGFKGIVVSDWGAVHSTVPTANAGLDIEMPEGIYLVAARLLDAVKRGDVKESVINDKVVRLLRVMSLVGLFEPQPPADISVVNSAEHRLLAREAATEGIVLLKNTAGMLPIDRSRIRSIAVIGPNAAIARTGGGGSSLVLPFSSVNPLDGIRARAGNSVSVRYAQGCLMTGDVFPVESSALRPTGGKPGESGLRGEYFANQNLEGTPVFTRVDPRVSFEWGDGSPANNVPNDHFSVRWTGLLRAPATAEYELNVRSDDGTRLFVNNELFIDNWSDHAAETKSRKLKMEKGKEYPLRLEFYENGGGAIAQLGWRTGIDHWMTDAVEAAKNSDVALVIVGNSSSIESEGFDRQSIALPGGQDELIEAVAKANPRTVVVLTTGAPVLMPWVDKVPGIVEAWFGGEEAGSAIADVLFGDANPSGKLPVTFLKSWEDSPAFPTYPGKEGKTQYAEGIFVGYRYLDKQTIEPLFPFGHGLSYTTFAYSAMKVVPAGGSKGNRYQVTLDVQNTGSRAGAEVVQVYVSDVQASVPRPPKELKGFSRVVLQPGEKQTVSVALDESSFAFFDPAKKLWRVEPGMFTIRAGSSSRDLKTLTSLEIKE